jgi:hypothetical protein
MAAYGLPRAVEYTSETKRAPIETPTWNVSPPLTQSITLLANAAARG